MTSYFIVCSPETMKKSDHIAIEIYLYKNKFELYTIFADRGKINLFKHSISRLPYTFVQYCISRKRILSYLLLIHSLYTPLPEIFLK